MHKSELIQLIKQKQSFLCVGLDPDPDKFPRHLKDHPDALFEFCKEIIIHTSFYAVAYKPNLAFFEAYGPEGLEVLKRLMSHFPENSLTIADAKRGDIGNTATMYAKAFFDYYGFDAITVAPYMGHDSVKPFLEFGGKWAILLALTSNAGANDFQFFTQGDTKLYENVVSTSAKWGSPSNMMYVVGATRPDYIASLRSLVPNYFFLVPGVGAQGGDLQAVAEAGLNSEIGLLVNASRSILYASNGPDFAVKAGEEAKKMQQEMAAILKERGLI